MRLLLSLLLLLAFSSEALADRGRLNRFGTLTVSTIEATGTLTLASESGAHTVALNTDGHLTTQTAGGQLRWASGSAAFPGYTFAAETGLGFARVGSGQLGVSVGGSTVATFDSGGLDIANGKSIADAANADTFINFTAGQDLIVRTTDDFQLYNTPGGVPTIVVNIDEGAGTIALSPTGSTVATFNSGGLDVTGEVSISGAATSTGVLCTKSDGDIGQCTSAVGAGGTCTCA